MKKMETITTEVKNVTQIVCVALSNVSAETLKSVYTGEEDTLSFEDKESVEECLAMQMIGSKFWESFKKPYPSLNEVKWESIADFLFKDSSTKKIQQELLDSGTYEEETGHDWTGSVGTFTEVAYTKNGGKTSLIEVKPWCGDRLFQAALAGNGSLILKAVYNRPSTRNAAMIIAAFDNLDVIETTEDGCFYKRKGFLLDKPNNGYFI